MLPNWLYTQSIIDVDVLRTVADHPAGPDGQPHARAFAAVLTSRLGAALVPADLGGTAQPWEQTGRAVSALATVCPATAQATAEHLAAQYKLARRFAATNPDHVRALITARHRLIEQHPGAPHPITVAPLSGTDSVDTPPAAAAPPPTGPHSEPALSVAGDTVAAALAAAVVIGAATTAVRAAAGPAQPDDRARDQAAIGAATAAVLLAQAANLRVLSMCDRLRGARECAFSASAAFLAISRSAAHLVAEAADQTTPWDPVTAVAATAVLNPSDWHPRIAATLTGDRTLNSEIG